MNEVIKVNFEAEEFTKYVSGLTQWNYGAFLEVAGLNIPDGSVEVHYSLKEMTGNSPRYIGTVKNGIMTCAIPSFITLCDTVYDYNGYAFIYLSDADSGTTIKKVVFNIAARPKPEDFIPPEEPGIVGQLLELLDNKVDKVDGKELSSNDYTDEEKNKLAALPTNEELTENIDGVKSDLQKEIKDTADTLTANMQGMFAEQDEEIEKVYGQLSDQISNVNSSLSNLIEETNTNAVEKIEELEAETDAKISEASETLKEEISDSNKAANETFANAVKGYASGEIVKVDDVSPIEHKATAKIRGKNLIPYPYVDTTKTSYGVKFTDIGDGTIKVEGTSGGFAEFRLHRSFLNFEDGITYSLKSNNLILAYYDETGTIRYFTNTAFIWSEKYTFYMLYLQYNEGEVLDEIVKPIICEGNVEPEYEPYIDPTTIKVTRYGTVETDNPETYTPDASGNVEFPSLSPTMTIKTDTAGANIDLEYNQDTNKALDNIKTDLRELEGDVAEIIAGGGGSVPLDNYYTKEEVDELVNSKANKTYVDEQIGDIDSALDHIIEIQNELMGVSE